MTSPTPFRFALTLPVLCLCASTFAADLPKSAALDEPSSAELGRAFVTIPYSELRALWEAGKAAKDHAPKPEPEPPVGWIIDSAECHLQLGEAASTLDATFDIHALRDDWQSIPLLGGDTTLSSAEAGELPVVWAKDGYALLARKPGKTRATLHMAGSGTSALSRSVEGLQWTLPSATEKRLLVSSIPAGMEVRVNGKPAAEVKDGTALFSLASNAGAVAVQLAAARIDAPVQPSRWRVEAQLLAREAEGRLAIQSRVFARAENGSGIAMELTLPAGAASITAAGDDLADWSIGRAEDGTRLLRVRWKTPDLLDRQLTVSYAVPQSPLAAQWRLEGPRIADSAEAARNLWAIIPAEGLELRGPEVKSAVAAQRLPQWMREAIGGAAFLTAEAGPQLTLEAHWLPAIATAEAMVTEAKCHLRTVADGSTQTTAQYSIRHQAPLAWQLELPTGVEILTCHVAGKPARPLQRPGAIELQLPAPVANAKEPTTITLVYAAKIAPFDPVSGQLALELPRTALFIERLDWTVAIPSVFETTAVAGNLSAVPAPTDAAGTERDGSLITLRKDLCRGERPVVEIFYQRRSLEK